MRQINDFVSQRLFVIRRALSERAYGMKTEEHINTIDKKTLRRVKMIMGFFIKIETTCLY